MTEEGKMNGRVRLSGEIRIASTTENRAIQKALGDLARDCGWVLGTEGRIEEQGATDIVAGVDKRVGGVEQFLIEEDEGGIRISGSDALGVVHGIYHFSERALGVDPFWFWKDREPRKREAAEVADLPWRSRPWRFRYRGWFLNDEDFLSEWKLTGGRRHIDYRFYDRVIDGEVFEIICETLLRTHGNMIIPASFLDIMNPDEEKLLRQAVERGLYVTQHHVEPLGLSHFGYENHWREDGRKLSYMTDRKRLLQTWEAYARRWWERAGEQVIWQLGLRGRGDVPVWASDASLAGKADEVAAIFQRIVEDQWEIVRKVDRRPEPPATFTIWNEGNVLIEEEAFRLPEGTAMIFCDDGTQQRMRESFYKSQRKKGHPTGVYYHCAFWDCGPHCAQGVEPEKIESTYLEAIRRGDTHYSLLNVANIREHLTGIAITAKLSTEGEEWDREAFWENWAPKTMRELYTEYYKAFYRQGGGDFAPEHWLHASGWKPASAPAGTKLLDDGTCWRLLRELLKAWQEGVLHPNLQSRAKRRPDIWPPGVATLEEYAAELRKCAKCFGMVRKTYQEKEGELNMEDRGFLAVNLGMQAGMMKCLYECVAETLCAVSERQGLERACAALRELLKIREEAERGKWADWYRGDRKEDWRGVLEEMGKLAGEKRGMGKRNHSESIFATCSK